MKMRVFGLICLIILFFTSHTFAQWVGGVWVGAFRVQKAKKIKSPRHLTQNQDRFGFSVTSIGDLDGDGFVDVAVGAPTEFNKDRGTVWILFLDPNGNVKRSNELDLGEQGLSLNKSNDFGFSLANIGDLDGDGVTDIAVGNPIGGFNFNGVVWIIFLNRDGTIKRYQTIDQKEGNLQGLKHQVNSFGHPEFSNFGYAIAPLNDLDGDGVLDIVVGNPWREGESYGEVWVLFLNRDGTVKKQNKYSNEHDPVTRHRGNFGTAIATIGDLDGDGINDVAVGSGDKGIFILYLNRDGSIKDEFHIENDGVYRLSSLAALGDLNQDGNVDLIAGGSSGEIRLLFLLKTGEIYFYFEIDQYHTAISEELGSLNNFGKSVSMIGDLNGDGFPEIVAGEPRNSKEGENRGALWCLFMEWGRETHFAPEISVSQDSLFLGDITVGNQGTITVEIANSGNEHLYVSNLSSTDHQFTLSQNNLLIPKQEKREITVKFEPSNVGYQEAKLVFHNNTPGREKQFVRISGVGLDAPVVRGVWNVRDNFEDLSNAGSLFGTSVTSLGDVNGDGTDDIAVGMPENLEGNGAVWILFMNPNGQVIRTQKTDLSQVPILLPASSVLGSSMTEVGDRDQDGIKDLAITFISQDGFGRRTFVYLLFFNSDGTLKNIQELQVGNLGHENAINRGPTLANVGDIDGDGIADLGIGGIVGGSTVLQRVIRILFLDQNNHVKAVQEIIPTTDHFSDSLTLSDQFGLSIAPIGDLDQDGTPDIVVGGSGFSKDGFFKGAVWILNLNKDGSIKKSQMIGPNSGNFNGVLNNGDQFGFTLAPLGDVNNDGVQDLAVGAIGDDDGGADNGAIWVLLLKRDGTVIDHLKISKTTMSNLPISSLNTTMGQTIATIQDLDQDGTNDLIIGDPNLSHSGQGNVWILFLDKTAVGSIVQSVVGDFDNNGIVDFVDFLQFARSYGGRDPKFDLDHNQEVGFTDFLIFANAFGK